MFTFMAMFISVYGAMNLYMLRWLKPAFGWNRLASLTFVSFAVIMIALSMLTHVLDRHDFARLARVTGLLGHLWMLLAMWIVSLGLVADVWNGLIFVVSRFHPAASVMSLSPTRFISCLGVVVAILSIWGVIEPNTLHLETISITTPKLPFGTRPLRVLQISDLHVVPFSGEREIARMLKLAGMSKPDLVVCTGDLFDSASSTMAQRTAQMALLQPPLGKMAVFGNHERYVGEFLSAALLQASGFQVLRNESVRFEWGTSPVVVVGVDDTTGSMTRRNSHTDEQALLPSAGSARPLTILLKHLPIVSPAAAGRFDLQLSGHTHGGQIFPFQFYVKLFFRQWTGLYELPDGSHLYVSPGVGTWGPPLRVLARPTMTLVVIRPAG